MLELDDMQALILTGSADLTCACYWLLAIDDDARARRSLAELVKSGRITPGRRPGIESQPQHRERRLQLALSPRALACFDAAAPEMLSREFLDGMVTPHRQRLLGDVDGGRNDPHGWRWGGIDAQGDVERPDVLLILFAGSVARLTADVRELDRLVAGLSTIERIATVGLANGKEHFGFRDGLSQPIIAGSGRDTAGVPNRDVVAAGEFVLGYADESGELNANADAPLLRNGSYLVLRQLRQEVESFWRTLAERSGDPVRLASKFVGRWPSGAPLTLYPDGDPCDHELPAGERPSNDFCYAPSDADGRRCPLGAHTRRSNPRDVLLPNPRESIRATKRHRLLRRGRSYGKPAPPSAYPRGLSVTALEDLCAIDTTLFSACDDRGLMFLCLNADLSRQFEFVQQSWLNNPKFAGLYDECDPIAGAAMPLRDDASARGPVDISSTNHFTMQHEWLRERQRGLEPFVRTVGGAYFFLPGISALRGLAPQA